MRKRTFVPAFRVAGLVAVLALTAAGGAAATEPFSHADWAAVLRKFVDDRGMVDYRGLSRDRATLDRYVERVGRISPRTHPAQFPDRDHQLAYWLNAYNALVFAGVLERGPEEETVWTGGLIPGETGLAFFSGMDVVLGGEETNLKDLEDDVIRAGFADPRIHAALNCASRGCPRLPREPFEGPRLDAQLDAAMRDFVAEPRNCRVDAATRTVTLSKLFDWFADDFVAFEKSRGNPDGTVIDYVNRYRAAGAKVPRDYDVAFFEYDKRINKQQR
jgi:hypothetical protein